MWGRAELAAGLGALASRFFPAPSPPADHGPARITGPMSSLYGLPLRVLYAHRRYLMAEHAKALSLQRNKEASSIEEQLRNVTTTILMKENANG